MKKTIDASLLAGARSAARRSVFDIVNFAPKDGEKSWYNIRAAADDVVEIYIMDEIGYWGVNANDFTRDLNELSGATLNLYVNSPGGSVFEGLAIYGALVKWAKKNSAKIIAHIDGWAASIASVIIMCADEIRLAEAGQIMIHSPSSIVWGSADDMRREADVLDSIEEAIIDVYVARTGGDRKEIADWVHAETWFRGQAAVDAGFADVLVTSKKKDDDEKSDAALATRMNAEFFATAFPNMPDDVAARLKQSAASDEKKTLPKTVRELSKILQNAGIPRDAADSMAAHGFKPKTEPREVAGNRVDDPTATEPRDVAEKRDETLAMLRAAAGKNRVINLTHLS
jgi:ATP-dependent protease ClpP protease subunit